MEKKLFICDAFESGFEINPLPYNEGFKDLLLTRENSDLQTIYSTTLFVTEGLIRQAVVSSEGIRLIDAYSDELERVTLIRTNQIGNIKKQVFKHTDMFVSNNNDLSTTQSLYMKTNFNPLHQFYFFVIDGFIYIKDNRIEPAGTNLIKINQISMDIEKKYILEKEEQTINKSKFYQIEQFKDYLSNHCYIVYFDKLLNCKKENLTSHDLPGRYDIPEHTRDLLITETGRILEYNTGGNLEYSIIEGQNLMKGHYRCFTSDNERWTSVGETPPYRMHYEDLYRVSVVDPAA